MGHIYPYVSLDEPGQPVRSPLPRAWVALPGIGHTVVLDGHRWTVDRIEWAPIRDGYGRVPLQPTIHLTAPMRQDSDAPLAPDPEA